MDAANNDHDHDHDNDGDERGGQGEGDAVSGDGGAGDLLIEGVQEVGEAVADNNEEDSDDDDDDDSDDDDDESEEEIIVYSDDDYDSDEDSDGDSDGSGDFVREGVEFGYVWIDDDDDSDNDEEEIPPPPPRVEDEDVVVDDDVQDDNHHINELMERLRQNVSKSNNGGNSLTKLCLKNSNPDPELYNKIRFQYRDGFMEALRGNKTVREVSICMPFRSHHSDQFCLDLGAALGSIPSLKTFDFEVHDQHDFSAVGSILEGTRQITHFKLYIYTEQTPPDTVDRAMINHPTMDTVHICYREDGDGGANNNGALNILLNPFPASLLTLQKLRRFELINYQSRQSLLREFHPLLDSLHVMKLKIFGIDLLPLDMRVIGNNIALNTLTFLNIDDCKLAEEKGNVDSKFLFQQLGNRDSSLEGLFLNTCNWHTDLAEAVLSNTGIQTLNVISSGSDPIISVCGLLLLLARSGRCLDHLGLYSYRWDNDFLCDALKYYIEKAAPKKLSIDQCDDPSTSQFTDGVLKKIIPNVKSLRELSIGGVSFDMKPLFETEELEVQTLRLCLPFSVSAQTLIDCIPVLQKTNIKKFIVRVEGDGDFSPLTSVKLSAQQAKVVLAAVRENFTLTQLPFDIEVPSRDIVMDEEAARIKDEVLAFLRMNTFGRSCLREGNSKEVVEMMVKLRHNLGCIHMMLMDYPGICKLALPMNQASDEGCGSRSLNENDNHHDSANQASDEGRSSRTVNENYNYHDTAFLAWGRARVSNFREGDISNEAFRKKYNLGPQWHYCLREPSFEQRYLYCYFRSRHAPNRAYFPFRGMDKVPRFLRILEEVGGDHCLAWRRYLKSYGGA